MNYKAICPWLLAMGLASQATAENLGTITVTGQRSDSPIQQSSRSITIIDRQTIEASHAENVVDLFKGLPDIVVRDITGVGAKSQVDLGGYGESAAANSVVLIDGRRINNPDLAGVDWSQIPVDQIERIEIVHGGGSVLYGQGAVGGVINIITRIPESGGRISADGGSFGTYEGSARAGFDGERFRGEFNLSATQTDGYRQNSGLKRFDGGARFEADLPAGFSLYARGNQHSDRAGLPGALTTAQLAADRRQSFSPNDFAKTNDGFLDGGLMWNGHGFELDLGGGIHRRKVHSEYVLYAMNSDFSLLDRSFRPKLTWIGGESLKAKLVAGADIDRGKGSYLFGGAFPLPTTTFKRKRDGYYGFADIGGERWHVNGGVRREKVADHFQRLTYQQVAQANTVWEAGASVGLTEGLYLHANAATSVRYPLLDERFNLINGTLNTGLRAQTGRHASVSLRQDLQRGFFELAFSRADLSNEIFYNALTGANQNYADRTRHDVWLAQGRWDFADWAKLSANYTYTRATFRGGVYNGKQIPAVPTHRVGASIDSDWGNGLGTTLSVSYLGSSWLISDQANARPKLPAYLVADAVVRYRWRDMELFARVDNLTNRKYSSYGVYSPGFPPFVPASDNYYPSPTLSVRGGASYQF